MKKSKKHPLHAYADVCITDVDDKLYNGSVLGGESLEYLLSKYKEEGSRSPIRRSLIKGLQRCLEAVIAMDSAIIAQHRGLPYHRVDQHYRRKTAKNQVNK